MGNRQTGMALMYRVMFHIDSFVAVLITVSCSTLTRLTPCIGATT